jgi:hypothetical protein
MGNKAINIYESNFEIFTFQVHRGIKLNVPEKIPLGTLNCVCMERLFNLKTYNAGCFQLMNTEPTLLYQLRDQFNHRSAFFIALVEHFATNVL